MSSVREGEMEGGQSAGRLMAVLAGAAVLGAAILTDPPQGLSQPAWRTAGLAMMMAIWWTTAAVPHVITALLPALAFPLLGVRPLAETAASYVAPVSFLVLGAAFLAVALERSGLHLRIALGVIRTSGRSGAGLVLGFMVATALVAGCVSATSAALMMIPIAVSVASMVTGSAGENPGSPDRRFAAALVTGVAYSATIGGLSTIVGSPANSVAVGLMSTTSGLQIGFAHWMAFGVPLAALAVPAVWLILVRLVFRFEIHVPPADILAAAVGASSGWTADERRVGSVILLVVAGWLVRPLLNTAFALPWLTDPAIALFGALLLFLLPSRSGGPILGPRDIGNGPWDLLFLLGGGIAMAAAIDASGLAGWLVGQLPDMKGLWLVAVIAALVAVVVLITEIASNVAIVAALVPVAATFTKAAGLEPLPVLMAISLAACWGFVMPAGTMPNIIALGTGRVRAGDLVRAGAPTDLLGMLLITLVSVAVAAIIA